MDAPESQSATTRARGPRRLGALLGRWVGLVRAGSRSRVCRGLVFAGLLATIIGLTAAWTFVRSGPRRKDPGPALARLLEAYDAADYETARRMATALRRADLTYEELGTPVFVLGATQAHDAEQQSNPDQRRVQFLIASRYLEEARDRSFPPGREPQGLLLLGLSLFESGRYDESIPVLTKAQQLAAGRGSQIARALALAQYRRRPPQLDAAYEQLLIYLGDESLTPMHRVEGLYLKAEIALAREQESECREAIAELLELGTKLRTLGEPERATSRRRLSRDEQRLLAERMGQAVALRARLHIAEAERLGLPDDAEGETEHPAQRLLVETCRELEEALSEQLMAPDSELLLGMVLRRLQQTDAALAQLERTAERYYSFQAGVAADVERAELLADEGRMTEAYECFARVLEGIETRDAFENAWISADRLQSSAMAFYAKSLRDGRYADAEKIAGALAPLITPEEVLLLRGDAFERWGDSLARSAAGVPYSEGQRFRAEAKEQYHHAADCFAELAELRFATTFHLTDLWRSAENYLRADDYRKVLQAVTRYLDQEPRRLRARALCLLGEARLSSGDTAGALEALTMCISAYPDDPDSYRARVLAARAHAEAGDLGSARALLLANLEQDALTPRSVDWRDSLFDLGELLHREGILLAFSARQSGLESGDAERQREALRMLEMAGQRFAEAATRLSEATRRYPTDARAPYARYLLADSYRNLARVPRDQLATESIASRRAERRRQMLRLLEQAYEQYDQLANELADRRDRMELTPIDTAILRNCYFIRGHMLFSLERYDEAIEAYSDATNRYQHDPSALEAYQQIAECYRMLNDPAKARGALEQARVVFSGLPQDTDYRSTTRFSREGWAALLQ